jgi:RNA polymerase sigma factor (sigma-70 family)
MKQRRYFVWKDAACKGINPEWIELTGKQFKEFVNNPENKNRYFIKFNEDEEDTFTSVVEATYENYLEYDRERKKKAYNGKKAFDEHTVFVDLDEVVYYDDDDPITRAEIIADEDAYVEPNHEQLLINELYDALEALSYEERELVDLLFLKNDDHKSERRIAEELGVPQKTLNCRKQAIIKKLKMLIKK